MNKQLIILVLCIPLVLLSQSIFKTVYMPNSSNNSRLITDGSGNLAWLSTVPVTGQVNNADFTATANGVNNFIVYDSVSINALTTREITVTNSSVTTASMPNATLLTNGNALTLNNELWIKSVSSGSYVIAFRNLDLLSALSITSVTFCVAWE